MDGTEQFTSSEISLRLYLFRLRNGEGQLWFIYAVTSQRKPCKEPAFNSDYGPTSIRLPAVQLVAESMTLLCRDARTNGRLLCVTR